jgi:hypothetical protein
VPPGDPKAIDDYRGTVGYKVVANDLVITTQVVRAHWKSLAGHTFISEEELAEAETLVARFLTNIGQRDQAPLRTSEASTGWVIDALRNFTTAWEMLTPENKGRLLRILVFEIRIDDEESAVEIELAGFVSPDTNEAA